ncbi:hypothetical protein NOVOSPHI9U_10188 [Novosphingobium sp. 9U]|nr:hypothetical protein NOVOSPHI9U_10188 [Novosphingobium sp. 9U]
MTSRERPTSSLGNTSTLWVEIEGVTKGLLLVVEVGVDAVRKRTGLNKLSPGSLGGKSRKKL